ncbi:MAG: hypothetical protein WD885_01890 [Candidatus Saccharimonadales bacterium]
MKIIVMTVVPSAVSGSINHPYKVFGLGDDSLPYIWENTEWVLYTRSQPGVHTLDTQHRSLEDKNRAT